MNTFRTLESARDMTEEYHRRELAIALDPGHEAHYLPPKPPAGTRVLDIGCGAGQVLIAIGADCRCFGLDPDFSAVSIGRSLTGAVRFTCGRAENLPYHYASFDVVVARLSLPYVGIVPALSEIRRVLKPGGSVWLMLHSWSLRLSWLRGSNWRQKVFGAYVLANSLLFHVTQRQVSFFGHQETFQTIYGMRRALEKCGFESVAISRGRYFVITAVAR